MAKPKSKSSRRRDNQSMFDEGAPTTVPMRKKSAQHRANEAWNRNEAKPLVCKNDAQKNFLGSIVANQITVGVGPAGTGKTFVSVKYAAQQLDLGRIDRIVVVRPIIESGKGLGFLKGTVEEKTAPYQVPFLEVLEEHYGPAHLQAKMQCAHPVIVFIAPEFIRGRTFKNAFVILDEAQNMDPDQMKTFLTRLGEDSTCVIQGDLDQKDIPGPSGLADAVEILEGMDNVGVCEFTEEDIVRSGICKAILLRYRRRKMLQQLPQETAVVTPPARATRARKTAK